MNIVGLLDVPSEGQYFLRGKEVKNLTADQQSMIRRMTIGFIFQGYNLLKECQHGSRLHFRFLIWELEMLKRKSVPMLRSKLWDWREEKMHFLTSFLEDNSREFVLRGHW